MNYKDIIEWVTNRYPNLVVNHNWGEVGLFYNPDGLLKKGIYLLTFKLKDGANDNSSGLTPRGAYRLNLGIGKEHFTQLFGKVPARPAAGKTVDMPFDFTEENKLIPHPVYAWMGWVCVINPDKETMEKMMYLIDAGYQQAVTKYNAKRRKATKS